MAIEDIIKEKLIQLNALNEELLEDKKNHKIISKASRTWNRLIRDRLNKKIGDC